MRWFTGETGSVANDPQLLSALEHTLAPGGDLRCRRRPARRRPRARPAALARPRQRVRSTRSCSSRSSPRSSCMGVALLLLFLQIFNGWGLGTTAQAIGQVTFAISYVVVIVRGRLVRSAGSTRRRPPTSGAPPLDRLAAGRPAAARAGDPRERGHRLRALDRRLRDHAVPRRRSGHEHRVDAALLDGTRSADAPRSTRLQPSRS